jgi:sugar phosphate isomerase/epimerase
MRTGFFTRVLDNEPLDDVAKWAAEAGFDALEVDMTYHVDGASGISAALETVRSHGIDVCALTYFGFLLDSDPAAMDQTRDSVTAIVETLATSGGGLVVTFSGRDTRRSDDDNYTDLAEFLTPLAARAEEGGVRIALENWPGPQQDFVATTPNGWSRLFEAVSAPNVGLNFDPSHLVWQGIDHERAFRAVAERVFLAHAKDTQIDADVLQQVGYFGTGWWAYRLPGHGDIDWTRWLNLLDDTGFDGVVSIEHEDADWGFSHGGSSERRKEGLVEGLRSLRASR